MELKSLNSIRWIVNKWKEYNLETDFVIRIM